jgi:hypothetical protein
MLSNEGVGEGCVTTERGKFIVVSSQNLYYLTTNNTVCSVFFNRKGNHKRRRGFALEEMDLLDGNTFKKMFRLDRATFDEVLERILPHMRTRNDTKAANSSGAPIVLKTRLAVSLRWLAGASYLDLCFAWGLAISTFFHSDGVLWPTLQAIDAAFHLGFPADDPVKLASLARGFEEHSCGIMKGCVLALDGLGVSTRQPFHSEVLRPKDYRFRKGGFALVVLAGCDADARFICASCNHSGSTNDIIAWGDSKLYKLLEIDKLLPEQYFFIGDEAFTNTNQFLSPWPGECPLFFANHFYFYIF